LNYITGKRGIEWRREGIGVRTRLDYPGMEYTILYT